MPKQSVNYLALAFIGQSVMAALWQNVQGKITIIAHSALHDLANKNQSEAVDAALEELGEEALSIKEVLFIVPYLWTDQGNLKSESKQQLQELSKELLLEPMGFVILEEGLCSWQENLTGLAFNGLILQQQSNALQVRLFIDGDLVSAFTLGKSDDLNNDLQELQARIKKYAGTYKRILYFDTSQEQQEYNQTVVLLRQQLGQAVEKLSPQQVAQIVVTAGAREVTGGEPSNDSSENTSAPTATHSTPIEKTDSEFTTPDFVINKPSRPTAIPTDATAVPVDSNQQENEATNVKKKSGGIFKFPRLSINLKGRGNSRWLIVGITLLLILMTTTIGGWWYLRSTYQGIVTATIKPQQLQASTVVPLTTSDSISQATSEAQVTLPASVVTQDLTVSTEVPTTGSKLTGDPAKGSITIFNKTDEKKSFPAGTPVYFNNLAFLLDEEVTVASASTQENRGSSTIDYGEQEASVTAEEFGPEGNISKDEELTVDNFGTDTYEAVSNDDFSGGSKREIQSVSAKDLDDALVELENQVKNQLETNFAQQSTEEKPVFFTGKYVINQRQQSAQVDEEAKFLTVTWDVTGEAYQVELENLVELAEKIFEKDINDNFTLKTNSIKIDSLELVGSESETAPANVEIRIQAEAVPELKTEELRQELTSTYYARAAEILLQQPGVTNAEAKVDPSWISPFFKKLPPTPERIQLNLKLE